MAVLSQPVSSGSRAVAARLAWLMFAALTALLVVYWAKFAYNAYLTAFFPAQIDYGEGIVWQQAELIPGPRMYGDLQNYPFLVFHYPPVYHLVVHAMASLGVPWLVGGRLVSAASALAMAGLAAGFVLESARYVHGPVPSQRAAFAGALLAGLLFATLRPIQFWADAMRVDMLAVAFEFLGMYLGLRSLRQPRLIYPAAIAFVLAVYTKQTVLIGAAATLIVLLLHMPARALRTAALAVLLGGLAFALFTIATDGGFVRHIILYNANRFSLRAAYDMIFSSGIIIAYPVYASLSLIMAAMLTMRFVGRPIRKAPAGHLIALLYFALCTISLVALGKSGASSNYLIPWVSSWTLLIGLAVVEADRAPARQGGPLLLLALFTVLIAQVLTAPKFGEKRVVDPEFRREYTELIALTKRATKPVLSDDMVLLMQAGKEVPWEPAIITELTSKGLFDERKVVNMIDAHALAFVVVTGDESNDWFASRYSPAVTAALAKAYPVERRLAGLRVLMPATND